jgi:hypothetical protein
VSRPAALLACVIATIAFSMYSRTLLPGVDLGDTGGFQAAVLWPETSARQAYPLYYSLARPFVLAVSPDNPARGLNLFSALCGALAAGFLAYFSTVLTGSIVGGALAGALLAFSHTFWTQSVIAEVYTLHVALIGCCLIALMMWTQQPTRTRLAVFFVVYAVSFGNHLSMILLLLPFTLFLFAVHPRRAELVQPATIGTAAGIVLAAAILYLPNFLFVWTNIDAPLDWSDRVAAFWFDVTKADWRETMVGGVDWSEWRSRLAMWVWDARLQFGVAGILCAMLGIARLVYASPPWALLFLSAYILNTAFALTYNVGDPHVFLIPGHVFTALAIAGIFATRPMKTRPSVLVFTGASRARPVAAAAGLVLCVYAGYRAWDTWPVANRHFDRRADLLVARTVGAVNDSNAVVLADLGWQSENALLYSARYERPQLAWRRVAEVLPHLPFFVDDNHSIGRDIVLAGNAAARVTEAYGSLFPLAADSVPMSGIAEHAAGIARGTPYVVTLLKPTSDERLDTRDFDAAVETLASAQAARRSGALFQIWAGVAGNRAVMHAEWNAPANETFLLLGDRFEIRLEGWLPLETFRRAGFGHVLRGRESILTIERGVSLVSFDSNGTPVVAYAAGLHAPKVRLRIPAALPQQVAQR